MKLTIPEALNRAIDAQKHGRVTEAEEIYMNILIKFPSHPDANHNLGILLLNRGEKLKGVSYLKKSLVANPDIKQFWLSYLNALVDQGRMIEAKKVFEQAEEKRITVDPFLKVRRALGFSEQGAQPLSKRGFDEGWTKRKIVQ